MLGDGAEWIWRAAGSFLGVPGVRVGDIVDIYHAYQHLWTVGNAVFGLGTEHAAAWVAPLKDALYSQGVGPVLAALTPAPPEAAEIIRQAQAYFTTHAPRMNYPAFVAAQYPIGSGAIESTAQALIAAREKGAGRRWQRPGAQTVARLRAVVRSGQWAAFWQTAPLCRRGGRRTPRRRCPAAQGPENTGRASAETPGSAPPPAVDTIALSAPPHTPVPAERRRSAPHTAVRRPAANHPWRHGLLGRPRSCSA